ncbi:MAG TPA: hypothetical protein PLU61_11015, partial [Rhodoglobus sp.]|nr:hypothetical protein [Rhodoglobus sp.]
MAAPKRRKLWSWIPAIVLALAIIAVIVTTTVLVRGGLGGPVPQPTQGQVTDLNWSAFTPKG